MVFNDDETTIPSARDGGKTVVPLRESWTPPGGRDGVRSEVRTGIDENSRRTRPRSSETGLPEPEILELDLRNATAILFSVTVPARAHPAITKFGQCGDSS